MGETLTLIFENGKRFVWNTGKMRDAMKAVKLQKKLGDPVEILGNGYTANFLRDSYARKDVKLSIPELSKSAVGKPVSMDRYNKVVEKVKKRLGIKEDTKTF